VSLQAVIMSDLVMRTCQVEYRLVHEYSKTGREARRPSWCDQTLPTLVML
jgi:hypothetical protein